MTAQGYSFACQEPEPRYKVYLSGLSCAPLDEPDL